FLKDNYQNAAGDSLVTYTAQGSPYLQHLGHSNIATRESYFNDDFRREEYDPWYNNPPTERFEIPYNYVPGIVEQNGGRYYYHGEPTIPILLGLDTVANESLPNPTYYDDLRPRIDSMEQAFQRMYIGMSYPVEPVWP